MARVKQFESLEAVSLFCPRCKAAMPVRKLLLLVLPDSEMFEYLCAHCGASVGKKTEPITHHPGPPDPLSP
jgi:DNA-directed RNA polymerase subunit RPC12/RpoP